jgi:tRNA A64-2'-O-ribosylphosphate transferase
LTPSIFWQHKSRLLSCPQEDLHELIKELLAQTQDASSELSCHAIKAVHGRLLVGARSSQDNPYEVNEKASPTLILADVSHKVAVPSDANSPTKPIFNHSNSSTMSDPLPTVLRVPGYYPKQQPTQFLTHTLPLSLEFIRSHLAASPDSCVTILCKDGKDLSVGIATAALALHFHDNGEFVGDGSGTGVKELGPPTKDSIRRRLQWVLSSCPGANPARATLRRINEYLMSPNRPSLQNRSM